MLMNSILYASSSQGLKNAVMAQMAVALVASTVLPDVTGVRPPPAPAPREAATAVKPLSLGGCGEGPPSILPAIPRGRGTDAPRGPRPAVRGGPRIHGPDHQQLGGPQRRECPRPLPAPGPRPPALSAPRAGLTAAGGRRAAASTW